MCMHVYAAVYGAALTALSVANRLASLSKVLDDMRAAGVAPRVEHAPARPGEQLRSFVENAKARAVLGWTPRVGFRELVEMMVDSDLELAQRERAVSGSPRGTGRMAA